MKPKDEFKNVEILEVWWHAITRAYTKDKLRFATDQLEKRYATWRWLRDGKLWRVGIPLKEAERIEKKNELRASKKRVENGGDGFTEYRREKDIPKGQIS